MISRFDHVNITVADTDRTAEFLKVAFPDLYVRGGGKGEHDGIKSAWVHFGTNETYFSLNQTDAVQSLVRDANRQTGINHVGFIVTDVAAVHAKYEAAGFNCAFMDEAPARRRLYVTDHDAITWEFVQYLADDPAVRNDNAV